MFQPTDYSGCFAWYRASDIGLGVASGYVTYWPDVSGSGNNLTPSASSVANWPLYLPNVIAGWPAVQFNGVGNNLRSANNPSVYLSLSGLTNFIVFQSRRNDVKQSLFCNASTATAQPIGTVRYCFDIGLDNNPSGWYFNFQQGNGTDGDQIGFTSVYLSGIDSTTWTLRTDKFDLNNSLVMDRTTSDIGSGYGIIHNSFNNSSFQKLFLGSNYNGVALSGYIAEVVAYNRRLSNSEVLTVQNYLNTKYFLPPSQMLSLFMFANTSSGIYQTTTLYTSGNTPTVSSGNSNIRLYIGSTLNRSGNFTLYTESSTVTPSSITLYEYSLGSGNKNIPLYIGSTTAISSGISLFEPAISIGFNSIPLFMLPTALAPSSISLYVDNSQSQTMSIPLYIGSTSLTNSGVPLYEQASFIGESGISLYLIGGLERKNIPLYTYAYTSGINTIPLFIGVGITAFNSMPLYMPVLASQSDTMPLFTFSNPPSLSSRNIPLSIFTPQTPGVSSITKSLSLYTTSFGNGSQMPLYIGVGGHPTGVLSATMPLFAYGPQVTGTKFSDVSLFVGNYVSQFSGPRLKMYVRGDGQLDGALIGKGNMPLVMDRPTANMMTLFTQCNLTNNSASLYLAGANIGATGVSIIIAGMGISSGNSLYITGPGFTTNHISLTISGQPLVSNNVSLYEHGF